MVHKNVRILFFITLLFTISFLLYTSISTHMLGVLRKNASNSFWNDKNSPVFYGATKITIGQGALSEFDVNDARFRIFARDFEDGDVTEKITVSGKVDVNKVGTYYLTYKVVDSHHNKTTLKVPVVVTEGDSGKIHVERTLYTIPYAESLDTASLFDVQMLGIYLTTEEEIRVRNLSSEDDQTIHFFNTDTKLESTRIIPKTKEWVTLKNSKETYSVPFVTTSVFYHESNYLEKTHKIEVEYSSSTSSLNYYHLRDDEENFKEKLKQDIFGNYGFLSCLESENFTILLPSNDVARIFDGQFQTIDEMLSYYDTVVSSMEQFLGLDLDPMHVENQRISYRRLVKLDSKSDAPYFSIANSTMASFFLENTSSLSLISRHYQELLSHFSSHLLDYYFQQEEIYQGTDYFLSSLSEEEERVSQLRLKNIGYTKLDEKSQAYVILNLFHYFEGSTTLSKVLKFTRENEKKDAMTLSLLGDILSASISEIYNVDILPFLDLWKIEVSPSVREQVSRKRMPLVSILSDYFKPDSLSTFLSNHEVSLKHGLVSNDILNDSAKKGRLNLQITIDDFSKIEGKYALLKEGNRVVKQFLISDKNLIISDLSIGSYSLQLPLLSEFLEESLYVTIREDQESTIHFHYQKQEELTFDNSMRLKIYGNQNVPGLELEFKNNYRIGTIKMMRVKMAQEDEEISFRILNSYGHLICEETLTDGYFDYLRPSYEVSLAPGFVIEIKVPHENRVKVYSTLLEKEISDYTSDSTFYRYIVTDKGIQPEDFRDSKLSEINYSLLKEYITGILFDYEQNVSEEELNHKEINLEKKRELVFSYYKLDSVDRIPYEHLIQRIERGGIPVITSKSEFRYPVGTVVDLYSLISATDSEDGKMKIDFDNTEITTNLNMNKVGEYVVSYRVMDADNHVASHDITISVIKNDSIEDSISPSKNPSDLVEENDSSSHEDEKVQDGSEQKFPISLKVVFLLVIALIIFLALL